MVREMQARVVNLQVEEIQGLVATCNLGKGGSQSFPHGPAQASISDFWPLEPAALSHIVGVT